MAREDKETKEERRERRQKRRERKRDKGGSEGTTTNTNPSDQSDQSPENEVAPAPATATNTADPDNTTNPNGGSGNTFQPDYTDNSTMHDNELAELQQLCDAAKEHDPMSWEKIRRWLRNHSADDARAAAERRGDYETTPLHLACRNCPPLDIVNMLLTASPRTVELADSFGWLPLHYACANEASEEVLVMIAEQYPESKLHVDKRKRTPLHFALGHTEHPANVATVVLLSGTGAALMADENGMLPLHYACAYGATDQSLRVLTDENIETICATDNRGRTPLHFALGNADRPASPGVVGLLLSQNPLVSNSIDLEGNLPIHLLATRAQAIKEEEREKCANCQECFSLYLNAHPRATADLLTALQSLPEWLRDYAVLSPMVQKILNMKISQRFPTAVTLMDFMFYVSVIVFFQLAVIGSLIEREGGAPMIKAYLAPLYVAVGYFSMREIIQAASLASLGLFNTWIADFMNWLDVVYILLILFWTIVMQVDGLNLYAFRVGAALSMCVFWVMVLSFLQSIIVGFAVFVGGVIYVTKRLAAFLVALAIILIAFSQIFYTLFKQTDGCKPGPDAALYTEFPQYSIGCGDDFDDTYFNNTTGEITDTTECMVDLEGIECEPDNSGPFCNFRTSFFKVFTMLLGEVDETLFGESYLATFLFAVFIFACVIVLANVLIAIVTDSYSVIQNERAALVFWSNRLDFVAEMDVIFNNFSRRGKGEVKIDSEESIMGELWKKVMYLFDDDIDENGVMSVEFIVYNCLRAVAACVLIPLWIIVGALTFGILWPPQVRVFLLTSQMASRTEKANAEQTRLNQVSHLKGDVTSFQEEVKADMEKGRDEMYVIRAVLDNTKNDIITEMETVKEIVTELFELLSAP